MNVLMTARTVVRSVGTFFSVNAQENQPNDGSERAGDDGFTLAEVIVSIALFTIMSVAATTAMLTIIKLTNRTSNRVAASNLAREQIDNLRLQNSTSAALLDDGTHTIQLRNTTFTVTTTLNPTPIETCASGGSRQTSVTVSVSGAQLVRYDTVLAC
jgi:prepilin-type N-terminal cleavage/methylation domain-containing protein